MFKTSIGLTKCPKQRPIFDILRVLAHLYPNKAAEMEAMAKQASDSRIYGGIHYRFDCEVGLQVGKTIGLASKAVAQADGAE